VLFTLSSLLCGLAWNIATLDVARGLQGIGGAALFATALAIIGHEYRGHDLFGALAVWGATVGAAVASGPLIGGLLTDGLGWRWIFFVNIPVGVFAFAVALTRIAESRDEGARRTDVAGLVTFSAALFLIVFGILRGNDSGWTSPLILLSLVGGVLVLVVFVVVALPNMQERFDASLTGLQWVVDAYALSLAALILTAGALADRYGRRLIFMAGVVLFTLSSLLCGLAWNIATLDVARGLQGIAAPRSSRPRWRSSATSTAAMTSSERSPSGAPRWVPRSPRAR
jgi:MFS family permease